MNKSASTYKQSYPEDSRGCQMYCTRILLPIVLVVRGLFFVLLPIALIVGLFMTTSDSDLSASDDSDGFTI
jgi:hypothetical protein